MPASPDEIQTRHSSPGQRIRELAVFLFLAFAIWPVFSVAVVGGYGFLVWMYQVVTGPPGPPSSGH
ncbi:MAG TPA: periplasmic nitrate reductase, NapE protein [Paracoccus sp. (in: a-proteobacteria)]|uniref:periplasmic nitrate reductase, NapE protein n=1 Tax=Paracoccus sp. TaxID=267 RepID=UPI002BDF4EA4|nr:periplasmic nitrate reductase, NapE protein [Paracoccus sp. (in: a-proteobacteria)]HWL56524.1 periplasmic nitrate reductase, NapE protein [Paracoccus sp. (in: a-proteobacteria)]